MNIIDKFHEEHAGLDATLIGEPVSLQDGSEIALFEVGDSPSPGIVTYMFKGYDAVQGTSFLRHPESRVLRMGDGDFNRGIIAIARERIDRWESRN